MEIKRRSPLVLNATVPSRLAKIVSSRPIPAPGPGRKRVPRWRTMIVPAVTPWPSKTLTPSIFGFESRPFRDEPSPFLWAISVPSGNGRSLGGTLALLLSRRLERGQRALALRVPPFVLERGVELLCAPAPGLLADLGDGELRVAARKVLGELLRLRRRFLLRGRPRR